MLSSFKSLWYDVTWDWAQVTSYQRLLKNGTWNYTLPTRPMSRLNRLIGLVGRVFANDLGDLGSILGHVIPKTFKKWYLIPPCLTLSIIRYVSRVKWSNPGKGVTPSPTPRCSSYWKGSLLVALVYGRWLIYIYIVQLEVNSNLVKLSL